MSSSNINAQNNIEEKMFEFRIDQKDIVSDGELFLLSNNVFCTIEYTDNENIVKSGSFLISDSSLILSFNPKIVTLGIKKGIRKWKVYLQQQITEIPSLVFSVTNSGNKEELLGNPSNKYLVFGTRITDPVEEEERIKKEEEELRRV